MTLVPCIVTSGGDHCDFCNTSPVVTVYPCANFAVNGSSIFPFGLAVGSWAACKRCAELVDAERWEDLTDRAIRKFAKRHGVKEMPGVREQFERVHRAFAEHRLRQC
jgi:hypothetical protein